MTADSELLSNGVTSTERNGGVTAREKNKYLSKMEGRFLLQQDGVRWGDVVGVVEAKKEIGATIIFPSRFPEQRHELNRRKTDGTERNILLYGPPGTGKNLIMKALTSFQDSVRCFTVSGPDLVSRWSAESEHVVRNLFSVAVDNPPAVVFLDRLDALFWPGRNGHPAPVARLAIEEICTQLHGTRHVDGVYFVAASNAPWTIDKQVLQLFGKKIYLPLPDIESREKIFRLKLQTVHHAISEEEFRELAEQTEGYTGADIEALVNDALEEKKKNILEATHFKTVEAPSLDVPDETTEMWTSCPPTDFEAVNMSWMEIHEHQLYSGPLTKDHLMKILDTFSPSTGEEVLAEFTKFQDIINQNGKDHQLPNGKVSPVQRHRHDSRSDEELETDSTPFSDPLAVQYTRSDDSDAVEIVPSRATAREETAGKSLGLFRTIIAELLSCCL